MADDNTIINTTHNQPELIEFLCEARTAAGAKNRRMWWPDFQKYCSQKKTRFVTANGMKDQSAQGLNKAASVAINEYCVNLQAKGLNEQEVKIAKRQIKQSLLVIKDVPDFGDLRTREQLELWKDNLNLIPADEIRLDEKPSF